MRTSLITLATLAGTLLLFSGAAQAASYDSGDSAPNQGFGLGAGWGDAQHGDSGILALARYRGESWAVEGDYLWLQHSTHAFALSGDYIFNFSRDDPSNADSGGYAGIGYTYVDANHGGGSTGSTDNNNTSNGFNVLLGYDVDKNWGF